MSNQNRGLYDKYKIINRETGQEVEGNRFVLHPANDPAARAALETYAATTNNVQLELEIYVWLHSLPELPKCDWCGEPAAELSHPHMFDLAIGKRMCRHCWDHDREVYKGSYSEDIGEFTPIGGISP
ncbi:hypothetical protein ACE3MQ_19915 [Paenibacillus lentus]|uniref:hypothetical protein n=1 Tax=Paenibacillus lentus TaxID=1338368 RepID=UPI003655A12E